MKYAELIYNGKTVKMPVYTGTENEEVVDISNLKKEANLFSLDIGYQNTASCKSSITYIDGEKGILRYRGYPIEQLIEKSNPMEVAYLLIYGELPTADELKIFRERVSDYSYLHPDIIKMFDLIPHTAHPMAILGSIVNTYPIFFPGYYVDDNNIETFNIMAARLISSIRTIAAFAYRKSIGHQLIYPRKELSYAENFLNMMFGESNDYVIDFDRNIVRALEILLIIHADHEQNCSTSTVRLVGSSRVNLYSSVCAGISALWGPLHGGANQAVIEMLENIYHQGLSVNEVIEYAKDKENSFKLMGFGHRVYKTYDPRAKAIKKLFEDIVKTNNVDDPLFDIAIELEEKALKDPYFQERNLYPNVDFYSGLLYKAIGIPTNMFTVMFAMGRMPGWIAQWKEMHDSLPFKIGRPRQLYIGSKMRNYVDIENRENISLLHK